MLNCSYTLPSFPRGGVYPSPYPALEDPPVTVAVLATLGFFWDDFSIKFSSWNGFQGSWRVLGGGWRSWVSFGTNLEALGGGLGRLLGRLGGLLGLSLGPLGASRGLLKGSWELLGVSWRPRGHLTTQKAKKMFSPSGRRDPKLVPKWDQKSMLDSRGRFYKSTYKTKRIFNDF